MVFMYCDRCGTLYVDNSLRLLQYKCYQPAQERRAGSGYPKGGVYHDDCGGKRHHLRDKAIKAAYVLGGYAAAEALWLQHKTWKRIQAKLCP